MKNLSQHLQELKTKFENEVKKQDDYIKHLLVKINKNPAYYLPWKSLAIQESAQIKRDFLLFLNSKKLFQHTELSELKSHLSTIVINCTRKLFNDPPKSTSDYAIIEFRAERKASLALLSTVLIFHWDYKEDTGESVLSDDLADLLNKCL